MLSPNLGSRWRLLRSNDEAAQEIANKLGINLVIARLLTQRGIFTAAEADTFLNPKLDDLSNPNLLPDFEQAKAAILLARERNEKIYIHGDYDVDGVTSAAILFRFLTKAGFDVEGHVPHRELEGYGIHINTIQRAFQSGSKLILTCDCGTSSHEQLKAAYELGMKVVVTDHHESPEVLPPAEAIVNPKRRDYEGPGKEMSGAGIAFLLCLGLCEELGFEKKFYFQNFLDLAVMGTVADVMPLIGDNRIIAKFGLPAIQTTKKQGLRALLRVSNLDDPTAKLTTRHIGYQLGPRINAVGRIDDADVAFKLLTTADPHEAANLANFLDKKNQERRELQDALVKEAGERIEADGLHQGSAIVVAGEGWQKGIVGIVAGKVVERYRRPAFVLGIHGDTATGSARSIPAFNLYDAIEANRHLIIKGGGHAAAAGVSVLAANLSEFAQAVNDFASQCLSEEDFLPTITIDQQLTLEQTSLDFVDELSQLEPFGEANPQPTFVIPNVSLATCTSTKNPEHVRVTLVSNRVQRTAMGFGLGIRFANVSLQSHIDVAVTLEEDTYNGNTKLKMLLRDFRESAS